MSAEATIARLRGLKSHSLELRVGGNLPASIAQLREGVELGKAALAQSPGSPGAAERGALVLELADCLGMLGGNLLRQGNLPEAVASFREGRDLEMSGGLELTYNTVNLLVARILDAGWDTLHDGRSDLETAARRLRSRTEGDGSGDLWAWADLGMCEFLAGRLDAARSAYAQAAALASPEQRSSLLARLEMLSGSWVPRKDEDRGFFDSIRAILK